MPTTPTSNYGWARPETGGDRGNWGGILNTTLASIDSKLHTVDTTAAAALPTKGGVMTGRIDVVCATTVLHDVDGTAPLDLAVANYFRVTPTGPVTIDPTQCLNKPPAGLVAFVVLRIVGGADKNLTFANVRWGYSALGASQPALTADDLFMLFTEDGGASWRGVLVEGGYR